MPGIGDHVLIPKPGPLNMALASTGQVLQSTRQWLKPLVHILLSCGVTWREFAELAKSTYVEVAMEKFGKRGRPTNISRMAILTGLVRRDVRKQRELLTQTPSTQPGYVTKASLVLSAWHLNPDFRDKQGRPAILRTTGKGKTFEGLIEQAGGADVRPSTLLKELVSAGTVRIRSDGRLQAMQRDYIPHKMDEELIRLWGTVVADVATTYVHNLTRTATGDKRLERSAVNDQMPKEMAPAFAQMLEKEAQAFLERVDEWLTAHQIKPSGKRPPPEAVRLGIGLYQIQDS